MTLTLLALSFSAGCYVGQRYKDQMTSMYNSAASKYQSLKSKF